MNKILLFFLLFSASCSETDPRQQADNPIEESNEIIHQDFHVILNSAGVHGSILILSDSNYYSNDFEWAKTGHLPASTFKIPNSIIALELGIIQNDSTMILWDGEHRFQKRWEQDLSFKDAFHASCVPCYQEIARKIGVERMRKHTVDYNYGELDFDSTNLDMFWLEGASQINQFQQIDFLKAFNEGRLSITERTHNIMSRMMIVEENNDYILRGKTGWSVQNNEDNCWFVGYITTTDRSYYFATNIEPGEHSDLNEIQSIRMTVTMSALKTLGLIHD